MATDLFAGAGLQDTARKLTIFRAELLSCDQASWEDLFAGFTELKAITFSSSLEMLLRLAERVEDMEIVFGSESILSGSTWRWRRRARPFQPTASPTRWWTRRRWSRPWRGCSGAPAHVCWSASRRARCGSGCCAVGPATRSCICCPVRPAGGCVTGSANLSLAAFEGRQQEVYVAFDGEPAWKVFDGYYQRDWRDSVPVEADALVAQRADGTSVARDTPLELEEVPIVRVLKAGVALVDEAPRPVSPGFAADQLRTAAALGAELKDLALPKDRSGRTVVNAASVLRVLRGFRARPVGEATEDRIPRAEIDFATGMVRLDGMPWLRPDETVPAGDIVRDARILIDYLGSFRSFFGNGAGAIEVYWAFLVWLYCAPAAPHLRQAAVTVGIDPWVYPVYAVLFGRSSGGKTLFTRIAARSMFGFEKMIRSGEFTANGARGLRDRLGAIPLLIDDVTRDRFTRHVPDLVRTDQEVGSQYAPVVLTTNRDVTSISPDLSKRMVTCHIDAAIPENRSVTERVARRAQNEIGTALYRAYLQRLIPVVRAMRAEIDAEPEGFPDLLAGSASVLRGVLVEALGELPDWAKPLTFTDYFGIRHRRFRDQLDEMLRDAEDRVAINRRAGELTISFGGDTNQAAQFARSVPDFALKGRFADMVKLDLRALEQEMGFAAGRPAGWWRRLIRR